MHNNKERKKEKNFPAKIDLSWTNFSPVERFFFPLITVNPKSATLTSKLRPTKRLCDLRSLFFEENQE